MLKSGEGAWALLGKQAANLKSGVGKSVWGWCVGAGELPDTSGDIPERDRDQAPAVRTAEGQRELS